MKMKPMDSRERLLRTIKFNNPDYISASFYWDGEWVKYHSEDEVAAVTNQLVGDQAHYIFYHPYDDKPIDEKRRIDDWGCIWQYEIEGIHGQARQSDR